MTSYQDTVNHEQGTGRMFCMVVVACTGAMVRSHIQPGIQQRCLVTICDLWRLWHLLLDCILA
jgi:hypothetical protein